MNKDTLILKDGTIIELEAGAGNDNGGYAPAGELLPEDSRTFRRPRLLHRALRTLFAP